MFLATAIKVIVGLGLTYGVATEVVIPVGQAVASVF